MALVIKFQLEEKSIFDMLFFSSSSLIGLSLPYFNYNQNICRYAAGYFGKVLKMPQIRNSNKNILLVIYHARYIYLHNHLDQYVGGYCLMFTMYYPYFYLLFTSVKSAHQPHTSLGQVLGWAL